MAVYEWDERKRQTNLRKHLLDFELAWLVLEDPDLAEVEDERRDYGESRYVGVGHLKGRVVVVVYSRHGETVRIISLRKANQREQKAYKKRTSKA